MGTKMGKEKKEKKEKKDKKDKKEKKEKKEPKSEASDAGDEDRTLTGDYQTRLFVSPIATPMADEKLTKNVLKLIKKGMKSKLVKRGIKETVKAVRKGSQGVVIIAADISPIDVLAHLPILCEDKSVPYVYVRSKPKLERH